MGRRGTRAHESHGRHGNADPARGVGRGAPRLLAGAGGTALPAPSAHPDGAAPARPSPSADGDPRPRRVAALARPLGARGACPGPRGGGARPPPPPKPPAPSWCPPPPGSLPDGGSRRGPGPVAREVL